MFTLDLKNDEAPFLVKKVVVERESACTFSDVESVMMTCWILGTIMITGCQSAMKSTYMVEKISNGVEIFQRNRKLNGKNRIHTCRTNELD